MRRGPATRRNHSGRVAHLHESLRQGDPGGSSRTRTVTDSSFDAWSRCRSGSGPGSTAPGDEGHALAHVGGRARRARIRPGHARPGRRRRLWCLTRVSQERATPALEATCRCLRERTYCGGGLGRVRGGGLHDDREHPCRVYRVQLRQFRQDEGVQGYPGRPAETPTTALEAPLGKPPGAPHVRHPVMGPRENVPLVSSATVSPG